MIKKFVSGLFDKAMLALVNAAEKKIAKMEQDPFFKKNTTAM